MNIENQASSTRIEADLEALARLTEPGRPWTRRAFSPKFNEGRNWLSRAFAEAGLTVATDAGGNLMGQRAGSDPQAGTIMVGSHSDTVPDGGRFDGVAGVVTALEIARLLHERGVILRHTLAVTDFLAEEVSIFGVSCIGSRAMAGVMPEAWLDRESGGRSLSQAMQDVGGDPAKLGSPLRDDLKAFFELHIEQGRVLEEAHEDAGIVTAIAGITRIEITVEGRPDHAGTTPMGGRADALVRAAQLVTRIEEIATQLAVGPHHFTATVGEFDNSPNAANVVPGHVRMLIDARAERSEEMTAFIAWLDDACTDHGSIKVTSRIISENAPTPMDPALIETLSRQTKKLGAKSRQMVSGAGHDAAFMARLCPAVMVFVPCRDGRSHAPEEWAEATDIALGAELIAQAIIEFDQQKKE